MVVRQHGAKDHVRAAYGHLVLAMEDLVCIRRRTAEEEQDHDAEQDGIIFPNEPLKRSWDIVVLMCILYSAVVVPIRVCFRVDAVDLWWAFDASLSLAFIVDVVLSFRTAHLVDGQWETAPSAIARRYLLGWFAVDALSSIPFEFIELTAPYWPSHHGDPGTVTQDFGALQSVRLLRLLRLVRLLRLLKLEEYMKLLDEALDVSIRHMRLVLLVLQMIFVAHLVGCGWFALTWPPHGEEDEGESVESWLTAHDDRFYGDKDVTLSAPLFDQYLVSVYWALVTLTTVGYGDLVPTNRAEMIYASVAVLVGALCFAYIVGAIGSLVASLDQQSSILEEKLDALKEYLVWRGVPRDLSLRTRRYYEHYYSQRDIFDETAILGNLNPRLNAEIITFILKDTLGRLPLFTHLSRDFQLACFPKLRPEKFKKGDVIFHAGEEPRDLFFLLQGEVEVLSRFDETILVSRLTPTEESMPGAEDSAGRGRRSSLSRSNSSGWKEGGGGSFKSSQIKSDFTGCFGQALLLGRRHANTHVASTDCEVLAIRRGDLEELLDADPRSTRLILKKVLKDYDRKDQMQDVASFWAIAALPRGELRSAVFVQYAWRRYQRRAASVSAIGVSKLVNEAKESFKVRRRRTSVEEPGNKRGIAPTSVLGLHSVVTPSSRFGSVLNGEGAELVA